MQHFKIHFCTVQTPRVGNLSPRAHSCRLLQRVMAPTRRKACMTACLLPATLCMYLHRCHTRGEPPVEPQEVLEQCYQREGRSAYGWSPSTQNFSFSCPASALLSSLDTEKSPYECAEEGLSPAYAGWTPLYRVEAAKHRQTKARLHFQTAVANLRFPKWKVEEKCHQEHIKAQISM